MTTHTTNTSAAADERPRMSGGFMGRGGPWQRKIEKAHNPKQALARLLPYLKPFRLALTGVVACVVAFTLLGLAGPYLMGVAIDDFMPGKDPLNDRLGLLNIALLMLLTYFLNNLFHALAAWKYPNERVGSDQP